MLDVLRMNHKISGLCYNFVIRMCHQMICFCTDDCLCTFWVCLV